jgi:hypothetical protein
MRDACSGPSSAAFPASAKSATYSFSRGRMSGRHRNFVASSPPWDFLLSASRNTLQSYELSRLSHAANVRKEIAQLLDVYLEESSNAMLGRALMEERENLARGQGAAAASEPPAKAVHSVSDNSPAEQGMPPPRTRGVL